MRKKVYSAKRIAALLGLALALMAFSLTAAAHADDYFAATSHTAKRCTALANQIESIALEKEVFNQHTWITAFGSCVQQQTAAQG